MLGSHRAPSVLGLLLLLTGAALPRPARSGPITSPGDETGAVARGDEEEGPAERRRGLKSPEEEEDLFDDVDPKTLAAVLLEALNQSQEEKRTEGGVKEERREEEEEPGRRGGADRHRDGRQELELLMAKQGEERQRQEEEERRRAQEEEERMTEKVTSRTTSQQVQVQQKAPGSEGGAEKEAEKAAPEEEEEEEQLSPEELRSLETMMKEFPSLDSKRNGEENQRESRGSGPLGNLAMSKKKLKWQEETQKGVNVPSFRGGNFMDEFQDAPEPPAKQEAAAEEEEDRPGEKEDQEEEEDDEDEEAALSPEEEEARARAEQEEMRRQAAEAQRAKMEEEKLADIASDMLLRYMVKQSGGGGGRKYGAANAANAAEDKRSDEEPAGEDDIDPQTIDKLIEISSKLHLPADDVVDIISDVEKKKKKDVAPQALAAAGSPWQQPLKSSSFSGPQSSAKNFPVSKQPSPAVKLLKSWFQDRTRPQDHWVRTNNLVSRPQNNQDFWYKPKPVWTRYPPRPLVYPLYYQRKSSYPDYYPVFYPPPLGSGPRYFLGNSVDAAAMFPPKRRYHSWIQPRLKAPPLANQQKAYMPRPLYPRTFQAAPKPRPPLQQRSREDLEKYIQQILLSRSQRRD